MELKKDLLAIEFFRACSLLKACPIPIDWLQIEINKNNNLTIENIFKNYLEDKTLDQSWAFWVLSFLGKNLDSNLRKIALEKIKDPMSAFNLYLNCNFFTEEEEEIIKEKFKDKLPVAEQELKEGKVKRWL